jgi:glycerol dehydrogenase
MLLAPSRYVQGAQAMNTIGDQAVNLSMTKTLLIADKVALSVAEAQISSSFEKNGINLVIETFNGECCDKEIDRLVALVQSEGVNGIIALGGGKPIDTGKAVAHAAKLPIIVTPTIAATDAPCSALSVIYTEDGVFDRYLVLPKNPDCVLVDTSIIAGAPVEFLVSGMGDALATFWEADTCRQSSKPNALTGATPPSLSALALARLCYDTLLEYGFMAKLAVEKNIATPAVEAVVEANTLLSGIGFESGGLAGAHAVHNGLTVLSDTHAKFHGEKVAFGTLVQLVMEGRPAEIIEEVLEFCLSVGLPVCLEDINVSNPSVEDIRKVAEATCVEGETIHATWFEVTPEKVEAAIWAADALGQAYKNA